VRTLGCGIPPSSFEEVESAAKAFDDPNLLLVKDRIDDIGEQRWNAIGKV
jgi:uncharacterized DUF497 family protein